MPDSDSSCTRWPAGTDGDTPQCLKQCLAIPGSQAWQTGVEAQTKAPVDQLRVQSSCLHPVLGRNKDILLVYDEKHLFLFLLGLSCLAQATELLPAECDTHKASDKWHPGPRQEEVSLL